MAVVLNSSSSGVASSSTITNLPPMGTLENTWSTASNVTSVRTQVLVVDAVALYCASAKDSTGMIPKPKTFSVATSNASADT